MPEPVGPVTRISPRGRVHNSANTGGVPSSLKSITLAGISRRAIATWPRSLKMETRNRPMSPKAKPKSEPPTSCNSCWQRSGVMLFIKDIVSSGSKTFVSSLTKCPSTRITGGWPTAMCKSLALRLTTVCNSLSMRTLAI